MTLARVVHVAAVACVCLTLVAPAARSDDRDPNVRALRDALGGACRGDAPLAGVLEALGGAVVLSERALSAPAGMQATRRVLLLMDGRRLRFDVHARDGATVRVALELMAAGSDAHRPLVWLVADGACVVRAARRIEYAEHGVAHAVVTLNRDLADATPVLALDADLPPAAVNPGIAVALVDSGVNYALPQIAARLARSEGGSAIGYDYWDMDTRPYDAHPSRSPFFPQRHGTRTASIILDDAPVARIAPYRYPRPNMTRMAALLADADAAGIRIVNLSLGGPKRSEWQVFEREAARRPHMLFVVSAGNNGRDIDTRAIYPASLKLSNLIVVTSSYHDGRLGQRANWGKQSVDLMVPAEALIGFGFDGYARPLGGSSYAAARVSALAACLLAANRTWQADDLSAAIFALAKPPPAADSDKVRVGWLPDPVQEMRGACPAVPRAPEVVAVEELPLPAAADDDSEALVALNVYWLEQSGVPLEAVADAVRTSQRLLAQCGVHFRSAQIHRLRVPPRLRYFSYRNARELVDAIPPGPLSAWIVRDTLERVAFDAQAIGYSNGRRHPMLIGSVWLTAHLPHLGRGLAHELYHVLADSGAHVPEAGNLMSSRTDALNTTLTDWQCERLQRIARAFNWITPPP